MVQTAFVRKGHLIKDIGSDKTQDFKTINAAKRWSREQQKQNGGLGAGYIRTEEYESPVDPIKAAAAIVLNRTRPVEKRILPRDVRTEAALLAVRWKMKAES